MRTPLALVLACLAPLLALLVSLSTAAAAATVPEAGSAPRPRSGEERDLALAPRGFTAGKAPGLHLTTATFGPAVGSNAWIVEFYSPYCGHCAKFAPTWEDVTKMSGHYADSSQLRLARVDCIAQGDLCVEQKVKWFPTVRLYFDGKPQGEYKGDRSYDDLMAYIKAKAADYRKIIAERPAPPPAAPILPRA